MSNDFISAKFGSLSVDNTINNYFPGDGLCAGVSNDFNVDMPWLCAQGVDFRVDATCSANENITSRSWGKGSVTRSPYALACGEECQAGTYGYRIISGDTSTSTLFLSTTVGLTPGLSCSAKLLNNYDLFGVIKSVIDEHTISVSPALSATKDGEWNPNNHDIISVSADYVVTHPNGSMMWVALNPTLGQHELSIAAPASFAFGEECKAYNRATMAHGKKAIANGNYAHAEGENCQAIAYASHAEGTGTKAYALRSHTEGKNTVTNQNAQNSHAEGEMSQTVDGVCSHAEGYNTRTYGKYSHAEGTTTSACGEYSHTEGYCSYTSISANGSHAEGWETSALANGSHAEGWYSQVLSTDGYSYVWNGDSTKNKDNPYTSHGVRSFSINPANGISGFYIGEQSFAEYFASAIAQGQNPLSGQTFQLNSMPISAMLSVLFSALGATVQI